MIGWKWDFRVRNEGENFVFLLIKTKYIWLE